LKLGGKGAKDNSKIVVQVSTNAPHGVATPIHHDNAAAAESSPILKLPQSACKAVLSKNLGFKIADCSDNIAGMWLCFHTSPLNLTKMKKKKILSLVFYKTL
jgi:hypothetical protein